MAHDYLPGIFKEEQDGNLTILPVNNNPVVLVIGTASQGDSAVVHSVDRVADSAREYGKDGTLTRGLYEASTAGALNLRLYRIGATPATLETDFGATIETVSRDDSAGEDYLIFWDDSALRLRLWRVVDEELVYDNDPSTPDNRVDLGEVVVTGTLATNGGADWGDLAGGSGEKTLADLDGEAGFTYTAGTDGLNLSRMKMYEELFSAYQLLEDQELDVVLPMNVYLDDLNVMDMSEATVSGLGLTSLSDYPTAGSATDVLGKVYVEEVDGENLFWWWFPSQPNASSPTFTAAQIYPSGYDADKKADGTTDLAASDFHEVNFAYQLANFCWTQSRDNTDMTGVIGVLPPTSFTLKDMARWVGQLPEFETDSNGNRVVATGGNGTGLLGNKFMSGRLSSGGDSGTPGLAINGVDGLANGGFIATDTNWLDGTHIKDLNDALIDIGKYISVVATYPVMSNPSRVSAYTATGASTYGGFYSGLDVDSAPTNKLLGHIRLPARINTSKLDMLAGQRYVTFHSKPKGIVISDGPTAARPNSDYTRLSTVRQVKATVDEIRRVGEPFLGESMSGAQTAALDTAVDQAMSNLVRLGVIQRYEYQLIITPQMKVLGQAIIELKIVPAFELRQITVQVALAAV